MCKDGIDIVIPWVDDSDEKWKKKKCKYAQSEIMDSKNRYRDYGTLKFVLRSIEKNMPWANNVFLLTDDQQPDWINELNVKVIDHTDFIKGKLPTFNSNSILTSIGNIKQLSERFIVFNDEMIVWRSTDENDFFKGNMPVDSLIETGTVPKSDGFFHISQNGVALINAKFSKRKAMRKNLNNFFNLKYGIQNLRTFLSLPYGGFIGFYNQHLVIPYTKQNFLDAYNDFSENFEKTWSHRFRELEDVNEWVVRYRRNVVGDFCPGYLRGQFFTVSNFENGNPSINKSTKIIVINDDDNAEHVSTFRRIEEFCLKQFPEKSKYEK